MSDRRLREGDRVVTTRADPTNDDLVQNYGTVVQDEYRHEVGIQWDPDDIYPAGKRLLALVSDVEFMEEAP